ncbi:head-tail adaptor protein [Rhodobacter lacus]|uniref:Head-tail adaptor protein n=1 Tax=Rhodobacter lacus TaxID=1641972 RepID=A0ABW5AA84_9RHOB
MSGVRLNRPLVLEEATRESDGAGGVTLEWRPLGTLWAEVTAGTGAAREGEAITLASVPWRIVVRAAPVGSPRRPRPEQRFREGGRIFRILAIAERDPGAHYLTCFAREEVVA